MRPRRYTLIDECAEVGVREFRPLHDNSQTRSIRLHLGSLPVVLFWAVDVLKPAHVSLVGWYEIYREGTKTRRVARIHDTHDQALVESVSMRLQLQGVGSSVGRRRWYVVCPNCRSKRASLFISPRNYRLMCRRCHR